jgi:putative SOS response-associated peptidase YedK
MCGRYYRRSHKQRIADAFRLGRLPDRLVQPPDYDIAPSTMQPVIRQDRETGERELVIMRREFVPYFAKSPADFKGFSTINAKAETVTSKAMWRSPFERRRCLVPADGFYEWMKLGQDEEALRVRLGEALPFAFAGRWDAWRDPTNGERLQTLFDRHDGAERADGRDA